MAWIEKPKKKTTRPHQGERRRRMSVYNRQIWRRLREWKLRTDPLCQVCEEWGDTVPGEDVHHIKSFTAARDDAERDELAYDERNLLTVCDRCHHSLHHGYLKGAESMEAIKERINKEKSKIQTR